MTWTSPRGPRDRQDLALTVIFGVLLLAVLLQVAFRATARDLLQNVVAIAATGVPFIILLLRSVTARRGGK